MPNPDSELLVEIENKERLYQGFIALDRYRLIHQRFDRTWIGPMTREVVVRRPAVGVLPYDPLSDQILLIEQFRLPARVAGMPAWQIEIVAGIQDDDETPEAVALREAREEAGCELKALIRMCRFLTSPGLTTEMTTLFLGRFDSRLIGRFGGLQHEHEDIRLTLYPASDAPALVNNPRAENAALVAALLWFQLNRERSRQAWLSE
jgi:ADP-ribose pyrophosphatase